MYSAISDAAVVRSAKPMAAGDSAGSDVRRPASSAASGAVLVKADFMRRAYVRAGAATTEAGWDRLFRAAG
ncbi:hypothetical protein BST28156_03337 [Burkholderia stagnalis]|nr:hypothetical protein BST28156_03337 [Burkholderia stagnalis]